MGMMLAFMPRSTLLLDSHIPNSMLERRTSLTVLPSTPMSYSAPPLPAALPVVSPSPSKRPMLSLNTSNISPIFGKSATSLRLETLSATSPTARNTFQNRNDGGPNAGAKAPRPVLTPLATNIEVASPTSPSPSQISLPDSADSTDPSRSRSGSVTSVSTVESSPLEAPYKLPYNANSILKNGPISRNKSGRFSFSQSQPLFPVPKKVGFRAHLTEEIITTKYTRRHSDIEEDSVSTAVSEVASLSEDDLTADLETPKADGAEATISSPTRVKRDSHEIDDDSDSHATTPVAGRAKRHRWVWTLGPVQPVSQDTSSTVEGNEEEGLHDS